MKEDHSKCTFRTLESEWVKRTGRSAYWFGTLLADSKSTWGDERTVEKRLSRGVPPAHAKPPPWPQRITDLAHMWRLLVPAKCCTSRARGKHNGTANARPRGNRLPTWAWAAWSEGILSPWWPLRLQIPGRAADTPPSPPRSANHPRRQGPIPRLYKLPRGLPWPLVRRSGGSGEKTRRVANHWFLRKTTLWSCRNFPQMSPLVQLPVFFRGLFLLFANVQYYKETKNSIIKYFR